MVGGLRRMARIALMLLNALVVALSIAIALVMIVEQGFPFPFHPFAYATILVFIIALFISTQWLVKPYEKEVDETESWLDIVGLVFYFCFMGAIVAGLFLPMWIPIQTAFAFIVAAFSWGGFSELFKIAETQRSGSDSQNFDASKDSLSDSCFRDGPRPDDETWKDEDFPDSLEASEACETPNIKSVGRQGRIRRWMRGPAIVLNGILFVLSLGFVAAVLFEKGAPGHIPFLFYGLAFVGAFVAAGLKKWAVKPYEEVLSENRGMAGKIVFGLIAMAAIASWSFIFFGVEESWVSLELFLILVVMGYTWGALCDLWNLSRIDFNESFPETQSSLQDVDVSSGESNTEGYIPASSQLKEMLANSNEDLWKESLNKVAVAGFILACILVLFSGSLGDNLISWASALLLYPSLILLFLNIGINDLYIVRKAYRDSAISVDDEPALMIAAGRGVCFSAMAVFFGYMELKLIFEML